MRILDAAEEIRLGPHPIPLLGQGNIWVEDSLADDSSTAFSQWIISQALSNTAPGQLEVIIFDEALTGIAAPFAAVNSGGERLMSTIHRAEEFSSRLSQLRDHVQGVNNVMRGLEDTIVAFRSRVDYPVESYKLVVVSADITLLDDNVQNQLSVLLKAGPRAGVSFLIHSMTLGANPFLLAMCGKYTVHGRTIEFDDKPLLGLSWHPSRAEELIAGAAHTAKMLASAATATVGFTEVQATSRTWGASSADGITFSVGRYGLETVEVTLGDELNQRHNVLVTGAVGQGKSNLLSVMIHSLCERYSPEELNLYLLDFKEGVTLQAFVNTDAGTYLPHAKVLGLEADREFGLSVFRYLFAMYKSRMRTFKTHGVQGLSQYRNLPSRPVMPRVVVVIDEFQMMFSERDRISDEFSDLLVRGVRLFRASGIHVVLASQTIGGNISLMGSVGDGLFGQIPIRVALKNSLSESYATLGGSNSAAAHLKAREAIMNLDYGDVAANRKTSIAFADEEVLEPLREKWWLMKDPDEKGPYVFDGEKPRSLKDDDTTLAQLVIEGGAPRAMLGSRVEVHGAPLAVPLSRDVGRNLAMVGSGDMTAHLSSIMVSLATQIPGRCHVVLIDLLEQHDAWKQARSVMMEALCRLDASVHLVDKSSVTSYLTELAASVVTEETAENETFILGLGLERMRTMPIEFEDICRNGPALGYHVIGWWTKYNAFRDHVGYNGEAFFDTRIAGRVDPQSVKQFFNDPLMEWKPLHNRLLVWDAMEMVDPVSVIPYSLFENC